VAAAAGQRSDVRPPRAVPRSGRARRLRDHPNWNWWASRIRSPRSTWPITSSRAFFWRTGDRQSREVGIDVARTSFSRQRRDSSRGDGREERGTVPAGSVSGGRSLVRYRDRSLTVAAR
jgi:hypothetical protein